MKLNTKRELKRVAQNELKKHFGFAPLQKEITLLETTWNGYLLFEVNGVEYRLENNWELEIKNF